MMREIAMAPPPSTYRERVPIPALADHVLCIWSQVIGAGDRDRLPRTIAAGRPATLVVLWQVDDCATAASGSSGTDVHVTGRWGTSGVDHVMAGPILAPSPAGDGKTCLG